MTGRSVESLKRDLNFGFVNVNTYADRLENPALVANDDSLTMFEVLRSELETADSFIFSVAFVTADAVGMIKQQLVNFTGAGTIITSTYLGFNDAATFHELLGLENIEVLVMDDEPKEDGIEVPGHHAKGYIFHHEDHVTALVGSSNLTRKALTSNHEWNLRFSTHRDGDIAAQLAAAANQQKLKAVPLTEEWIEEYERRPKKRQVVIRDDQPVEVSTKGKPIRPNKMQADALAQLNEVVESGEEKALIISATGTGKTILAALAVRQLAPARTLFVVHREQILKKAAEEFGRVLQIGPENIGFFVGQRREIEREVVFATVQTLSRPENLADLSPYQFDMVIIDEVHRSGAETYQSILNHFRPAFTLGLTATPERTDGYNIFKLFDYNVAYEIRLEGALKNHMLVPFDYYGVADYESAKGSIGDKSKLSDLVSPERVEYIAQTLEKYSFVQGTKGLVFCSSNKESFLLAQELANHTVHGRKLRTLALSGEDTVQIREEAVARLEAGDIDYLFTVDIFNEGVDIPPVNVVVLLRSTESSIVFTQQLGRGLRKYDGKKSLRVIDFIGNYANNYLIPIALTGNRTRDPDSILDDLRDPRPKAGNSTISFDKVSQARVIESLKKATLSGLVARREAVRDLEFRLGRTPQLIDFFRHETFDPPLLASATRDWKSYWSLLHHLDCVKVAPSDTEDRFLFMLSTELLNGKRPQELLLLRELLARGPNSSISLSEYSALLLDWSPDSQTSHLTMESVERVLNLEFFVDAAKARYGGEPLVVRDSETFVLGGRFADLYYSYAADHPRYQESFRAHVDDCIETGLAINRRKYNRSDTFVLEQVYSRKDASRLLNWRKNMESTIYGYKVDARTQTCPIFVTYQKDADVAARVRYEDTFLNASTLHWFSKNDRKLNHAELQPILNGTAALHLFVKREDSDGLSHYLGEVKATNPQQQKMAGNNGAYLDVVTTDLKLQKPVSTPLFKTLTAAKSLSGKGT